MISDQLFVTLSNYPSEHKPLIRHLPNPIREFPCVSGYKYNLNSNFEQLRSTASANIFFRLGNIVRYGGSGWSGERKGGGWFYDLIPQLIGCHINYTYIDSQICKQKTRLVCENDIVKGNI